MPPLLLPAFRVAAAAMSLLFWSAAAGAQQCVPLKDAVPSLTTVGTASAEVVPDIATISLGVETERPTAAEAASENARAAQAIIGEIKAQGIDPRDVRTVAVTLSPVYDETNDSNGRLTKRTLRGYVARNDLRIRVRQIDKAGALAQKLMEKGANSFGGVEYDHEQKELKYDALRGEAIRDALRRATSYVNGLGVRLGRVLEIAAPPYSGGPPQAASFAKAAPREAASAVPIEPGVLTLRTEVSVTWELAQ
ncbi:SIMPL domain-containing protein [Methylocapsa acidiphila]|uniref:SIMPL domain-containing protein n=1 Tax=Methylocapsa acidiphila TaxID=133552 RepID=UPI00041B3D43|nr:SIMPL domain-containing protein [Methylocapsa acidiphila]